MNKHKHNTPKTKNYSTLFSKAGKALNKERNSSSQQPAFTIIEVVLVLAIAGLIFLMVFIALPALQRNQRDAQRKNDMFLFVDAFTRCKSLNKGRCYASSGGDEGLFNRLYGYIGEDIKDPSTGAKYGYSGSGHYGSAANNLAIGRVSLNQGAGCDKDGMFDYAGGEHPKHRTTFAVVVKLEGGGYFCASNENL